MKEEPCTLIIAPMPDTKHCIMYWKLLHTNTHIKSEFKKASDRPNSACSSLMCAGIIFWLQRQEETLN